MTRYVPKLVNDHFHGPIDIHSILPLIETREFQALRDKRQLGMTDYVFIGATHKRFEHCLGAYRSTRTFAESLKIGGVITPDEQRALYVYAAIHDIGHPAYSHVTEDFCPLDDDERTLELLRGHLRTAVEQCGANPELVITLADHSNPLYRIVHDKNLGREKLDYLQRDGFHTGIGQPPGIEHLRRYSLFVDGQIAIDEKVVDHAIDTMNFYMKMYKEVYFRKSLVIAQRMFQKAVYHLILSNELHPEELYDLTDSELVGRMAVSNDPWVRLMRERLRERKFFKEAVVIRTESSIHETRILEKPIEVRGVDASTMQSLTDAPSFKKGNHDALERLESEIARAIRIPEETVLVVPVFNPERFRATDVMVCERNGRLSSLRARREPHFQAMEATARSYAALRVCTTPDYRGVLSAAASDVLSVVLAAPR